MANEKATTDVKSATQSPDVASSAASAASNAGGSQQSDAQQGVKGESGNADSQPETMADVAAQVAAKHGIGTEDDGEHGSPAVKADSGKDEKTVKTEEVETDKDKGEALGEEKKEDSLPYDKDKGEGEGDVPPGTAVPYERFKQVNEKAKTFETQLKEIEPVAKTHQQIVSYCRTNGITQTQFSDGLKLMSLINSNPAEAVKHLTNVIEQLQGFVGDKLPDDLQTKVDTGKLDVEDAKEIASLRAKTKHVEARTKQTADQIAKQSEEKFYREVHASTAAWEQTKAKADPDMREGTEKYQLVLDKFRSMSDEKNAEGEFVHPIQTVQDYIKLLDSSYAFVDKFVKRLAKGQAPARKVLTSTASSVTAEVEPTSMQDIAKKVGAKHGISI